MILLYLIHLLFPSDDYSLTVQDNIPTLNARFTPIGDACELGEGPHWDAEAQLLYWVCMRSTSIHSYSPATGQINIATIDTIFSPLAVVVPQKGHTNRLLVGIDRWLGLVHWDGRSNETVRAKRLLDLEANDIARLNDGKADPANHLCVGSMGLQTHSNPNQFHKDAGILYMVDQGCRAHKREGPLQISNGLDWSPRADKMYLVDSLTYSVYQFDYDIRNGSISNKKVVFDLAAHGLVEAMNSLPDGMTVDEEGMLWVAVYGSQMVIRVDPNTGRLISKLFIPGVLQPTSVAFGGPDLDILFVTTASVDMNHEKIQEFSDSGKLIRVEGLGVRGLRPGTPAILCEML